MAWITGDNQNKPIFDRLQFPNPVPSGLMPSNQFENRPGEPIISHPLATNELYAPNTQTSVEVGIPLISQGSFQSNSNQLLECIDEWTTLSENCVPIDQSELSLINHSSSQLDLTTASSFSTCEIQPNDPNCNNNNSRQLPSLTFSQPLQILRDISSPISLSSVSQPTNLCPSSPFSSDSSPFCNSSTSANNCASQNGTMWLPETSDDSQSTGGPSPYNSPQKLNSCPDYFTNAHVPPPSTTLQLRI